MEYAESKTGKMVFARLFENEDLLEAVTRLAKKSRVSSGLFWLIGTLKEARLGFFREGKYETIEMVQPLEIVSCIGNISLKENKVFAHAHITVSDEKGRTYGGHVMLGCLIGATGELVLIEATGIKLLRKLEKKTELYLWAMETRHPRRKKPSA